MHDYQPEARILGRYMEAHGEAIGSGIENGLKAIASALHQNSPLPAGDLPCPSDCGFYVSEIKDMTFLDGWATQCSLIVEHLTDTHGAQIGGR